MIEFANIFHKPDLKMLDSAQCVIHLLNKLLKGGKHKKFEICRANAQKQHQNLLAFDEMMLILMQNVNKN